MVRRRRLSKAWQGIRRHGAGWQAKVTVNGEDRYESFPLETPIAIIQAWRTKQKGIGARAGSGTLAADTKTYLLTVAHMPDAVNRESYLAHWQAAFGGERLTLTITTTEINTIMSGWLIDPQPRPHTPPAPYGPVTVRHHRTTLLHLFKRLYPDLENPVASSFRPRDPASEARSLPLASVWAILDKMKPDGKTRARLMLILTTGIPHKQIGQLEPADWDRERKLLRVTARKKGGGAKGRVVPLSEMATAAMIQFDRVDAWGEFSASTMRWLVQRLATQHSLTPWTPYQLRHVHGTLIYQATGDLATVARLLGHSRIETAQRYAQDAFQDVDREAQAKVSSKLDRG